MRYAVSVAALLLIVLSAAHAQQQLTVCVPFPADSAYLTRCTNFFNTFANSTGLVFVCQSAPSAAACMGQLANGGAHISRFGGDDMYIAGKERNLPAIAGEDYGNNLGASYYSVAVVRKAMCDVGLPTLASLKGKRMCSTGYRRSAGWSMPFGLMLSEGIMPVVDAEPSIQQDAESVAAFFSNMCAAGTTNEGPITTTAGARYPELCGACRDPATCARTDEYADYAGAWKCLKDNASDVAFTKHDIPFNDATVNKDDFRLLCPQGGCRPLSEFGNCSIAKSAGHAVFVGPSVDLATRDKIATALVAAAADPAGLRAGQDLNTLSGTTQTPARFFFQTTVKGMRKITESFDTYFGASGITAFQAIRQLTVPQARFCTVSIAEQNFCTRVVALLNDQGRGFRFGCVQKTSSAECIKAVRAGEAEVLTADGADIYEAHKPTNNLKVIVAEDYGIAAAAQQYYAVAVVSKEFCEKPSVSFRDLRGTKSCHTGYKRSAGWAVPVGFMVGEGIMPVARKEAGVQDDAEAVAQFFSGSCAARTADNGPRMTADGRGTLWEPLCAACKKDDANRCTTQDPYYDYAGAFRCLMERSGDVAFTKHSTVMDYARDGATPQAWSVRDASEFRLLCPTGGCQPVTRAASCHISRVPAHAIMVRVHYAQSRLLKAALVGAAQDPAFANLVFNRSANPDNLLFKSSAVSLVAVDDDTRTFLGPALKVYEGLEIFSDGGVTPAPSGNGNQQQQEQQASGGGGSKLGDGAIAGIVVGCSVAAALTAVVIMLLLKRRADSSAHYNRYAEGPGKPVNATPYPSTQVALSTNMHGNNV